MTVTLVKAPPGAKALDKEGAKSLRDRALAAARAETRVSIEYAEVLWATYNGAVTIGGSPIPVWEAWDYKSWNDYVERELEIHITPARAYVRMYQKFYIDLKGEWDEALLVSMTKMLALCKVVKKTNADYWLKRAAKMSCCELNEAINQALYGLKRKGRNRAFLAMLTNKELSNVNAILEVAKVDFPEAESRADLTLAIFEEWYGFRKAKGNRDRLKAIAGGKK